MSDLVHRWPASLEPPPTGTCCSPCTPDARDIHWRRDELMLPLAFPHCLFTSSSFPGGGWRQRWHLMAQRRRRRGGAGSQSVGRQQVREASPCPLAPPAIACLPHRPPPSPCCHILPPIRTAKTLPALLPHDDTADLDRRRHGREQEEVSRGEGRRWIDDDVVEERRRVERQGRRLQVRRG